MAGKFVWRALTQVTRYLTDDEIRAYAQQQVLDAIGDDTRLVVGHSLGSVVAYEALHHANHPTALLTLRSPLGLRTVVYDRLRPKPSHVPPTVIRWDNLVDRDDLVAAHLDLAPYFLPATGSTVAPVTAPALDNGAKPHDALHYLTKKTTGRIITDALSS
jgi:pimeloyl-ACP methyl ester carboxylesterase